MRLYTIIDKLITRTKKQIISSGITITRNSGGTLSDVMCQKIGSLILIQFRVTYSTAVAAGGDFFNGKLTGYRPVGTVYTSTYISGYPIMASINPTGSVVVRNTSTSSVTISAGIGLSFIYAIDE